MKPMDYCSAFVWCCNMPASDQAGVRFKNQATSTRINKTRTVESVNNTYKVTLVSFLTYFVLSAMLAPIGILSTPMAEYFGQSVTDVTKQFAWLTGGTLVGAVIALFAFDWVPLKRLFILIYSSIGIALLSLFLIDALEHARYILGWVGVGSGVGLAGAAITISHTYSDERRASMLVITDACFSTAGFVTAWTATWLISLSFGWSTTYQLLGLVAITIAIIAARSEFPRTTAEPSASPIASTPWPYSVWLCVVSLFLYTLGQYSILFWLPNYAVTQLGAQTGEAGGMVGQFWLGMFFAQLFVAWWVLKIGVRKLVLIASITTLAGSITLWNFTDVDTLLILSLIWGFANLSMLKAILSLATEMVSIPSPRLVSLLLLGATLGTAISPVVTSWIVEWTDNKTILMFGSGCYATLLGLMLIAGRAHDLRHVSRPDTAI